MKVHAKKIKVAEVILISIPLPVWRSGASGAELANIINEAALCVLCEAVERLLTQADLEESIEVVIAGYQKKNAILTDRRKEDCFVS